MVHEKPAAFLLLCLKYVLTARDEADTLMPAPKPSKETIFVLFCFVIQSVMGFIAGEAYQKLWHM